MIRKFFLIFLAVLNLYAVLSAVGIILVWNKYKYADLSRIEPAAYQGQPLEKLEPDALALGRGKTRSLKTDYNIFDYHINRSGTRNPFEVAAGDRAAMLLGDSFIFGFGLNDGQTLADFLHALDPGRKYLNLGVPGFNLWDSVDRYLQIKQTLPVPDLVIVGITGNDAYDSRYIFRMVNQQARKDIRFILPPFNRFITAAVLEKQYLSRIEEKVFSNESLKRFSDYLEAPLKKLVSGLPKEARIMVVLYDSGYQRELCDYCANARIPFFPVRFLLGEKWSKNLLPDRHPSADSNRLLADGIMAELIELGWK